MKLMNVYVRTSQVTDYLVPVLASDPEEAESIAKRRVERDAQEGNLKRMERLAWVECTVLSEAVPLQIQVSDIVRERLERQRDGVLLEQLLLLALLDEKRSAGEEVRS
jgi:hypothetical protein